MGQIDLLQYNNTILTQDNATLQDQLALCKSQLKNALTSYEQDIKKMQPVVESFIQQSQSDHRQLQSLRNDFGVSCLKILHSEKAKIDAVQELETLQSEHRTTAADLRFHKEIIKKLEEDVKRQSRLKTVAVASKVKLDENIQALENKIKTMEEANTKLSSLSDAQKVEISDIESYVDQLHGIVQQAEAKAKDLADQLSIQKSESTAQELIITKLKEQNESMSSSTSQNKIYVLEDEIKKLKSQLTASQRKITNLNMEIDILNGMK